MYDAFCDELHTKRSSYTQTLHVLEAIKSGEKPEKTKKRLQLSRYSYEYTLNRLMANRLVEPREGALRLTGKAMNILSYGSEVIPIVMDAE